MAALIGEKQNRATRTDRYDRGRAEKKTLALSSAPLPRHQPGPAMDQYRHQFLLPSSDVEEKVPARPRTGCRPREPPTPRAAPTGAAGISDMNESRSQR